MPMPPERPQQDDNLHILERCLVLLIILLSSWLGMTHVLDLAREFGARDKLSSRLSVSDRVDTADNP